MARRPTTTTRLGSSGSDDVFLEKTLAFGAWADKNRQLLLGLGVAALVIALGAVYYWNYRRTHLQQAAVELERVEQAAAFGDTANAKVELARYVESFGNTPYGDEARLLLGQVYLAGGQTDEAVKLLEPAADLSEPLGLQVGVLLAQAREQKGDLKGAEDLLLQIATRSTLDFQVRGALENAARLRAQEGNAAGAIELYERILKDLDKTAPERGVYEMRLQELKAKTQAG